MKTPGKVLAASVGAVALTLSGAAAALAATMEDPDGPLVRIEITEDLNCAVDYVGDEYGEFYGDTACGTFVAADGVLYGPAYVPAGPSYPSTTPWEPVTQEQGGSGVAGNPYWTKTTVRGGELLLVQTDTYVVGENSYRTSIDLKTESEETVDAIVYRGADCYLQDDDYGFGSHNERTGAVTCRAGNENGPTTGGRIEEFVPLTHPSNYFYGRFSSVWDRIEAQEPLPNVLEEPDEYIDNGIALSWTVQASRAGTTVSSLTNFSPIGLESLPTTTEATPSEIDVWEETSVTVSVENPNFDEQLLQRLTLTLSEGLSYIAGSTTGAGEPVVEGQKLVFTNLGPIQPDATLNLAFNVRGMSEGTRTVSVAGETVSGAPLLGSATQIEVKQGQTVIPAAPEVVQGTCPAPGQPTDPEVNLPADTDLVHYALEGDVEEGGTVTVVATAQGDYIFPATLQGWSVTEDSRTATMSIVLEENPCDPIPPSIDSLKVDPNPAKNVCPATTAQTTVTGASTLPDKDATYRLDVGLYKWTGQGDRPAGTADLSSDDWEKVTVAEAVELGSDGDFKQSFVDLEAGQYEVEATLWQDHGEGGLEELDLSREALTVKISDCSTSDGQKDDLAKTGASVALALLLGGGAIGSGAFLYRKSRR